MYFCSHKPLINNVPRFNPTTGEWEGLEPPSLPRYNSSSTSTRNDYGASVIDMSNGGGFARTPYRPSLFERINESVAAVGDWLADFSDNFRSKLSTGLTWLFWIAGAIGLIAMAFNGHWIMAIIVGLVAGSIYVYATMIVAVILSWLVFIPIALLRFIFYNVWTLMIAIAVCVAAWVGSERVLPDYTHHEEAVETVAPLVYYCEAWVLNVRDQPDKSGNVIGVVQRGDVVNVTDLYAGEDFAAIDFNGQKAYVSRKYISHDAPQ